MSRRRLDDPWYIALYQNPARFWWLTPLVGAGVVVGIGWATRSLSLAFPWAMGWLALNFPLHAWLWRRDKRRAERDAPTA